MNVDLITKIREEIRFACFLLSMNDFFEEADFSSA
ncbi:Uncharacterised protein [Vibrio vulnificus]|nr:hypothetical protein VVS222_02032 [Vibrio vulnificus]SUQ29261.1 Uncharacterised protein [Vibrio vulnificus]